MTCSFTPHLPDFKGNRPSRPPARQMQEMAHEHGWDNVNRWCTEAYLPNSIQESPEATMEWTDYWEAFECEWVLKKVIKVYSYGQRQFMHERIRRVLCKALRHEADDKYCKGYFEINPIDGHAFASELDGFVMEKCNNYKQLRERCNTIRRIYNSIAGNKQGRRFGEAKVLPNQFDTKHQLDVRRP